MKSILSTCALFLVLPWKLTGETTVSPGNTTQNEDTYQTTVRENKSLIFSTKNINRPLEINGETTHSPNSTTLHKGASKDHQTTIMGEKPTDFSSKNTELSFKPNGETTHSPSSTGLHRSIAKDQPTTLFLKNEKKNVSSSKSPPQTSEHHATRMSHTEYLTHAMTISTEESRSSTHLTSWPFMTELTQKKTNLITTLPQKTSEEVVTTREDHTLHNFTSTIKGLDRHTQGKKTTRSAEQESFKPQTDISTHSQNTPEVFTNQSVQTTETLTTKWASLPQEKESTHMPILNITDSNGTLNISSDESSDTATFPHNTSTNTGFSTGVSPTVNSEVGTTGTTESMDAKATYEITTKAITGNETHPTPNSRITPATQTATTEPTTQTPNKNENKKSHPGHIVATLIGGILFLMFVAFVVIWVRNRQKKKRQTETSDWAGPSPFIEADINPNLQTIDQDGSFHRPESKRISLYSFLPQQLSKRFSMLSPTDEEIPLENAQASSTFGQRNVQPLNGKTPPEQIQTQEANSPPAELSSDPNVPENVSIPPATENNKTIQTTTTPDEIAPSPPAETNDATPFEDVDLNLSQDKNTETSPSSDAVNITSPPPLAPS